MLLQRLEHHVLAAAVELAQRLHVLLPRRPPVPGPLGEVGRHEHLRDRRGAQVRPLFAEVELLQDGPRRDRPPEPQPRREDLRERAQVDDEVRGPRAAERFGVQRVERRQRVALVAQQAVGVVLEHQQLALAGHLHEPPAPGQRHRHPGRVLEVGDRVDELRPPALGCEAVEGALELVDRHPLLVHVDLLDVGLVGGEGGNGTRDRWGPRPRSRRRGRSGSCRRGRSPAGRRS